MDQVRSGLGDWLSVQLAATPDLQLLKQSIEEILHWETLGKHLTEPYRVVLAGPPNVGKSSLINRIIGYGRTITHDAPGTTRDVINCETVIDGITIRLSDTAGIREGGGEIEREGIRRGSLAISEADLVVLVVSPFCLSQWSSMRDRIGQIAVETSLIEVLNQADRLGEVDLSVTTDLPALQTVAIDVESRDNATDGIEIDDGIESLMQQILHKLRPTDPSPGQPIPLTTRQTNWLHEALRSDDWESAMTALGSLRDGTP
jgi:tRNA modification GTPase